MQIDSSGAYSAINWNNIEDSTDLDVWNRVVNNFWVPEKVPLSNDLPTWRGLTDQERLTTMRVFTGLTLLDTMQGTVGVIEMLEDATTFQEEAVLTNFAFMESVHAKSYSSIFSTLATTPEIEAAFKWSEENPYLQRKADIIYSHYTADDPLKKKISSVMLESYMFYSGFFLPLYYAGQGKLTNTADIIRLIIRDEAVHGYYIGYKFQKAYNECTVARKIELIDFAWELLSELHENEVLYAADLYAGLPWASSVVPYMEFNGNKAMANLGFKPYFLPEPTVDPIVLTAMDPGATETHDFFSGSGSSYVIGKREELGEDDWG